MVARRGITVNSITVGEIELAEESPDKSRITDQNPSKIEADHAVELHILTETKLQLQTPALKTSNTATLD
ncbi:MAG: hypothetical protein ACJAUG_000635 [Halioglobus sp.]|jgi:hypothetical protein